MYLREIQGLRVVAALLVAAYHIWFKRVSGGVDVFFVVSGFFVCRAFFDAEANRRGNLLAYYRHTLARVVPSSSSVIVATCVVFFLLDANSLWADQIKSALASLAFIENWRLAVTGTDYLAQGETPSPFQQMWALSVQVQVYFGLPLLLIALSRLARSNRATFPALVFCATCFAFFYAVAVTTVNQPRAYFDTFARLWEILAGVVAALWLPRMAISARTAKVLGHCCLLVLVFFAALIPVGRSFPGPAALAPVLATYGIIFASLNGGDLRLLNNRPMQAMGDLSFTFYLWHWPLLVAWQLMTGQKSVGFFPGLSIIVIAGFLSWGTHALIEKPFRRSMFTLEKPAVAFMFIALAMTPSAMATLAWASTYLTQRDAARHALALFQDRGTADSLVPATIIAKSDVPASYRAGCNQRYGRSEIIECEYGHTDGDIVIALAGGSHSLQWLPALQRLARSDPRIRIISMTKGNCPLTYSDDALDLFEPRICTDWSRKVVARILQLQPDVVITLLTSTRKIDDSVYDRIPNGFRLVWSNLQGVPILAIRDTPRADLDIVLCIDIHGTQSSRCDIARPRPMDSGLEKSLRLPDHIRALDLSEVICDGEVCPAVRNNVLVYRDESHFTATYARTLTPHIYKALLEMGIL